MTAEAASTGPQRGLAARGTLLLALGLIEGAFLLFAFRLPNITTREMILVLGVFMAADGLVALLEAAGVLGRRAAWGALAGDAAISLAAGVTLLFLVEQAARFRIFPVWAIVTGFFEGVQPRVPGVGGWERLVAASLSVAFGVFMLAGPISDGPVRLLVAAVFAIVAGALRLRAATRPR